jgi:hypothetical protein
MSSNRQVNWKKVQTLRVQSRRPLLLSTQGVMNLKEFIFNNRRMILGFLILLLAISNPSETDHDNAVLFRESSYNATYNSYIKNRVGRTNLIFLSFTNLNWGKGGSEIVGIGFLGQVYLFSNGSVIKD